MWNKASASRHKPDAEGGGGAPTLGKYQPVGDDGEMVPSGHIYSGGGEMHPGEDLYQGGQAPASYGAPAMGYVGSQVPLAYGAGAPAAPESQGAARFQGGCVL